MAQSPPGARVTPLRRPRLGLWLLLGFILLSFIGTVLGGLWADYERTTAGGLVLGSPRNQQTNVPGLYAIGECDYQYHGANRLGANSLLSCIFSGLIVAPSLENSLKSLKQGKNKLVAQYAGNSAFVASKLKFTITLKG